jgi:hypothetical protein
MANWQKEKIIEIYYVLSKDNPQKVKITRTTIKKPSINEVWFYHAHKKNIDFLQQMLDENIIEINAKDNLHGETILHRAIQKRSLKLIDFCIKNNANLHIVSGDDETPLEETTHRYISMPIFKKIWLQVNQLDIVKYLTQESLRSITMIERLCTSDKNIPKLLWLEKTFPKQWQELKDNTKIWNKLIEITKEREAKDVFLLLKGLQKIKNDLEMELQNKTEKTKRLKI